MVQTSKTPTSLRFYGWVHSLKGGQKRYLERSSIPGHYKESPYGTVEDMKQDLIDYPHALRYHEFSVSDRQALPPGWDGFIHWELVEDPVVID